MKTIGWWMTGMVLLGPVAGWAQTADSLVAQGRTALAARDMATARARFAAAVAQDANHEHANALLSIARLLDLPNQPVVQSFLTRLGVAGTGRDIYAWKAGIPEDAQGRPVAPAGVSADEFARHWRTNALPEITGALANLARITNPNFILTLASNETTISAVTMDHGDILLLRAGLHAFEYFSHSFLLHDFNAQLSVVKTMLTNDAPFDMERLLADHPQLFTFTSTNDLAAARQAFSNLTDRYADASNFILARQPGITRLFNFADTESEQKFRVTLEDLRASLVAVTPLRDSGGSYTLFAGAHFSGRSPLRTLLPEFRGPRMVLGSLPDPTFGGVLVGRSRDEVEGFLFSDGGHSPLRKVPSVPVLGGAHGSSGQPFGFRLQTKPGEGYVIEASTNLANPNWTQVGVFMALDNALEFVDGETGLHPRRFYRVVERTQTLPPPGNDQFANRAMLSSGSVEALGYNRGATFDVGQPVTGGPGKTVWYTWTAPSSATYAVKAEIGDHRYFTVAVFTGTDVTGLTSLGSSSFGPLRFSAVAGTTYHIAVDGQPFFLFDARTEGGFRLSISQPPTLQVLQPPAAPAQVFTQGQPIVFEFAASDPDGTVREVRVDGPSGTIARLTTPPFMFSWTNAPVGDFQTARCSVVDNHGFESFTSFVSYSVRPANDNFANRAILTGLPAQGAGSNVAATAETGEPQHATGAGMNSVWWKWTAPSNATVVIVARLSYLQGFFPPQLVQDSPALAVYTGGTLGTLTRVVDNSATVSDIPAIVSFAATAGTEYQIALAGFLGDRGDLTLVIRDTAATGGASFTALGFLPGFENFSWAGAISGDGSVVFGTSYGVTGGRGFFWTAAGGMVNLGLPGTELQFEAYNCSVDGQFVVGRGGTNGWRWQAGVGFTVLGAAPNPNALSVVGYSISGDGGQVVGLYNLPNFVSQPAEWTSGTGVQDIGTPASRNSGAANDLTPDGQLVVGSIRGLDFIQRPWRRVGAGAMEVLSPLKGYRETTAEAVSTNGNFIVGAATVSASNPTARRAVRWTSLDGFVSLGTVPGYSDSEAWDVSGDGRRVVGSAIASPGGIRAMVWELGKGMRLLQDVLIESGVNLNGFVPDVIYSISADGTTVVGQGRVGAGPTQAFVARLPDVLP